MRVSLIDLNSVSPLLSLHLYQLNDPIHFCAYYFHVIFKSNAITTIISNRFFSLVTFLLESNVTINSLCRVHTKNVLVFHNCDWQLLTEKSHYSTQKNRFTTHRNKSRQFHVHFVHAPSSTIGNVSLFGIYGFSNRCFFAYYALNCWTFPLKVNTRMSISLLLLKPNVFVRLIDKRKRHFIVFVLPGSTWGCSKQSIWMFIHTADVQLVFIYVLRKEKKFKDPLEQV